MLLSRLLSRFWRTGGSPGAGWVAICILGAFGPASAALGSNAGEELYRSGLYEQAIEWWKEDATKGDASSAYRLGTVYADGIVVKRDYAEARKWYEMGAKGGDRDAMFDLGSIHENGFGVEASLPEAARWYRDAANLGHAASQYNLATMYEHGEGVEQDKVQAYMWYYLAARQGFIGTRYGSLENLRVTMSDLEIKRGLDQAFRQGRQIEAASAKSGGGTPAVGSPRAPGTLR